MSDAAPTIIYDLTGQPLFADYAVVDAAAKVVGTVRSSAREAELPLIDSILIGNPWYDAKAASDLALKAAAAAGAGTVGPAKLVCYGYPRLGVLVVCEGAEGQTKLVYDAGSGSLVRRWSAAKPEAGPLAVRAVAAVASRDDTEPVEGIPFYSFLGAVAEGAEGETTSAQQWNAIKDVFQRAKPAPRPKPLADLRIGARSLIAPIAPSPVPPTAALPASGGVRFAIRGALLPVTLYSQETEVFCGVAAAEMILSFVGISRSQKDIAKAMRTGVNGTTNDNFIAGLSALTEGRLKPRFIASPDFATFVSTVETMMPAKSGIPGHARLLRGWREYIFFDEHGRVLSKEQFLVVNDPYPVSSGQLVLENITKPVDGFYANVIAVES